MLSKFYYVDFFDGKINAVTSIDDLASLSESVTNSKRA